MTDYTELERLEAAATKGPWRVDRQRVKGPFGRTCADMRYANGDEDAAFITALRNSAPALIAKARAYDALLVATESLRTKHDAHKSIAVKLAAFCCRVHGREEDVAEDVRKEAIKLAHEFKATEKNQ